MCALRLAICSSFEVHYDRLEACSSTSLAESCTDFERLAEHYYRLAGDYHSARIHRSSPCQLLLTVAISCILGHEQDLDMGVGIRPVLACADCASREEPEIRVSLDLFLRE